MSVASKVTAHKAANPHLYCPTPRCLWRTSGGPCPRHGVHTPLPGGLEELSEQIRRATMPTIIEVPWKLSESVDSGRPPCGWLIDTDEEDRVRTVVGINELDGGGGCASRQVAEHICQIHNLVLGGQIRDDGRDALLAACKETLRLIEALAGLQVGYMHPNDFAVRGLKAAIAAVERK